MTFRRRLAQLADKPQRTRAPITEDERRRRYFATAPESDARQRLAERIGRMHAAAQEGDEAAAAQLETVRGHVRALVDRRES